MQSKHGGLYPVGWADDQTEDLVAFAFSEPLLCALATEGKSLLSVERTMSGLTRGAT